MKITNKQKELFKKVQNIFEETPVYLVGGAVRDIILEVEPKDYDFCTSLEPNYIEESIKSSGRRAYLTGKRFGTIGCKIDGEMIEVTTFRTEKYEPKNRKPEVEFVKDVIQDLSRRDFTINSMALRLDNLKLIDPFNGKDDLDNKIIKCVGIAKHRFREDPLRILRAIRFATRFNGSIESKTSVKIQHMAIHLLDISKERWMIELDKILLDDNVSIGLRYLFGYKIFNYLIPELSLQFNYNQNSQYHNYTLDIHTIKVVEAIRKDTDDLNLLWAGLLHDIAKPFVRTNKEVLSTLENHKGFTKIKSNYINHEILGAEMVKLIATHLKWSNKRTENVVNLVRNHLEDNSPLRKYDNEGKKIKRNNIVKNEGLKTRIQNNRTCQKCGKKVKRFHIGKGKFLCYNCYRKTITIIPNPKPYQKTMEQALSKVYEVKGSIDKSGYLNLHNLSMPQVLIGHKIKFYLVDEDE